jgi:UDP-N-acetylmuramyl pentapeptide phosphotransferase/UDP-N-acetylglucosamine-1-phosphate transferase
MEEIDLILYLISLLLGGAGAWSIARYGMKLSLFDKPKLRSSHKTITPKGGGIGILAVFFVCSIVLSIPKNFWIPAVFLSLFSLWGDRSEIRPKVRLLFQFIAGIILLIGTLTEKGGGFTLYFLIPLLTVFIVGTANFYNFMDGINGISGITGIIGFGMIAFYALNIGNSSHLSTLAICMSISCVGFLPFNVPKAKVFMGDVGSILLGFVFSGMVVYLSKNVLDFICLMSFLFPFYADELTTMLLRLKDGENLTKAHRRHLYQILVNECEIPHWKISVGYGLFQFLIGISILLLKNMGLIMVVSALVFYGCFFTIFSLIFRRKIRRFA